MTEKELERYDRQIIVEQIGIEGQKKLKRANVLVVGAGGLGGVVLQYLVCAGIGTVGIIDYDKVDISNLNRQILFREEDLGKNKSETAKNTLKKLNSNTTINYFNEKLSSENALKIFPEYNIIVDATDNIPSRYIIDDTCKKTNKPFVHGSICGFEGQISVFNYKGSPSYRDLFPSEKNYNKKIGVIGFIPGIIGAMQANEVIKIILNIGSISSNKIIIFNALKCEYTKIDF